MSTPSTPTSASSLLTSLEPFSRTSIPRLQALYSDFSQQKRSNPSSYQSNIDWWHEALKAVLVSGLQHGSLQTQTPTTSQFEDAKMSPSATMSKSDRLVLHVGRELMDRLRVPKVGKPLALGTVLFELRNTRTVVPLNEFLDAKVSIYNPGWLPTRIASFVVGKPLWWALEQVGLVGDEGLLNYGSHKYHHKDTTWWGDYAFIPLLEKAANAVVERHELTSTSPADSLFTFESFRTKFAGVAGGEENLPLRETDTKVLIKFLERERGAIVVENNVIKFIDKSVPLEERRITPVDRGILELKSAIHNLQLQIEAIQSRLEECTRKASSALQQKRKPAALTYLRTRKQLEDLLQKRLGSLGTLESTFITVEAAAGDVDILKSYESSTATLRAILAHPSLERSRIDATMEALAEANADARDVDDAVRIGGNVALGVDDVVDDAELEEELEQMIREAKAIEKPVEEQLDGLRIPETSPSAVQFPSIPTQPAKEAIPAE